MLSNAVALAVLTTSGFIVIYAKLPRKLRKTIQKYDVLTDISVLLVTYWFLGGTITALVAGALVGLFVSALLHIANNPDDYLFLMDFKDWIGTKFQEIMNILREHGREYRARNYPEKEAERLAKEAMA